MCQQHVVFLLSVKPVDQLQADQRSSPSLGGSPAADGHLEHPVGDEQGGLQGQVGHGAGAVLGADPALHRLPFVGEAICSCSAHIKTHSFHTHPHSIAITSKGHTQLCSLGFLVTKAKVHVLSSPFSQADKSSVAYLGLSML